MVAIALNLVPFASELLAEIQGKPYKESPQSAQQAYLIIRELSTNERIKLAKLILEDLIH